MHITSALPSHIKERILSEGPKMFNKTNSSANAKYSVISQNTNKPSPSSFAISILKGVLELNDGPFG